jgi:hypothetical protein
LVKELAMSPCKGDDVDEPASKELISMPGFDPDELDYRE